jgi:hypothetical protein
MIERRVTTRPRRPPGKIFGVLIEEVRFAADSLLEESGFEPSVPPRAIDRVVTT